MAFAKVETKIQNPAGLKRRKTNVAKRHMTAKQIRFFGTKRQKSALKAKHSHSRHNAASRVPKRSNPAKKRNLSHKKRNPVPEIISLTMGNPATKKRRNMAATKKNRATKKNAAASRHKNAGSPHHKKNMTHHKVHRKNPAGLGKPMDWLMGGVGVIGGAVGARVLPQLAGTANTGGMGYAMNLGAALGLGFLSHLLTKNPVITGGVIAGGVAATLVRVVSDNTTYGSYLALSGVGDYVVWNFSQPQRVTGPNASRIDTAWNMPTAQAQSTMIAGSIDKFRG